MRRQQLSEAQITALLDPPTDQRELGRHYTLFAADLAAIRRCRGDCNRLGHALMLCYLRYPGRPLKAGERPPWPLLLFIAEQIDALPEAIEDYLIAERNRRRHAAELQDRLGFRPFGTRPAADLAGWLMPHAIETDRLAHLARLGWRSAGGAGSSSHRAARSSGSASKPAIGRVARSNAG
jgi:TnpA family transposase